MERIVSKLSSAVTSCCLDPTKAVIRTTDNDSDYDLTKTGLTEMTSTANSNSRRSTYEHQSSLPRLPIPELESTLDKFLSTVEPLLSPSQFQQTQKLVEQFGSTNGDGQKLQKLLEEYDRDGQLHQKIGSYIEEFWTDAYLAPDCSVVLNLNPFFLLEDDPDAKKNKNQIRRAASLAFHSLKLAASLKNECMKPDKFKNVTLCMDQFKSLFGSCRIPCEERDLVEVDMESDHVAVLYRNQFYYFRALWPREMDGYDGNREVKVAVDEEDVIDILQSIVSDGKNMKMSESASGALGVLTTLPRKQWAKARHQLIHTSEENKSALEVIDTALFVLVLDDFYPENVHDAAANMLHGTHVMKEIIVGGEDADEKNSGHSYARSSSAFSSAQSDEGLAQLRSRVGSSSASAPSQIFEHQAGTCCNRWYDKLQIIVCSDGSAGINFEHSSIDGHTALRFASDVFAETLVTFAKSITKSIYTQGCPIPSMIEAKVARATILNRDPNGKHLDTNPKKLEFEIVEKLKDRIFYAETSLGDAINADDTHVLEFDLFGKTFIVGNKMSPDSVVQMSIILGYYRLYGEAVCAYEPVLTKKYFHGRTEAMRSTTMKSVELCKVWTNRFSTKEEKLGALRESTENHSKLVKESSKGKGVDRHLYALKCLAEKKGIPIPEFFQSDAWQTLNHTVLSTSNCGNPALRLFGFGPVVPDGFGVGYIIKDSRIQYSISSKHRQTKRFARAIYQTLSEIGELLEPLNTQSLGYHNSTSRLAANRHAATVPATEEESVVAEGWDDTYGETMQDPKSTVSNTEVDSTAEMRRKLGSFVGRTKASNRSLLVRRGSNSTVGTQISEKK